MRVTSQIIEQKPVVYGKKNWLCIKTGKDFCYILNSI